MPACSYYFRAEQSREYQGRWLIIAGSLPVRSEGRQGNLCTFDSKEHAESHFEWAQATMESGRRAWEARMRASLEAMPAAPLPPDPTQRG